jgi:hypothetical protein
MSDNPTLSNELNLALAQSFSVGVTALAMANSISVLMENAVGIEQDSQLIQTATVTQCCALMIAGGAAKAANP